MSSIDNLINEFDDEQAFYDEFLDPVESDSEQIFEPGTVYSWSVEI